MKRIFVSPTFLISVRAFFVALVFGVGFFGLSFGVLAVNEERVTIVGGAFPLSGFWGGALDVGGKAEVRSVSVEHVAGTVEGSLVGIPGDSLTFSYTPGDPMAELDNGIFKKDGLVGRWAGSLTGRGDCTADPAVFTVGADQYSFVLCGTKPSFTLASSNASVGSCSGMVCTASGVGSARITATLAGTPIKIWGRKNTEGWTELVSSTLPGATLSWDVQVVTPPTLTFAADAGTNPLNPLPSDTGTTLSWSAQNVAPGNSCSASGDWSGTKPASGTFVTGNLQARRDYTLTCTSLSGDTVQGTVTVYVGSPNPVPIITLSAGSSPIVSGTSTTITWNTSANTVSCLASGDWNNTPPKGTSGSYVTGNLTSAKTYILTCYNATNGSSSRQITVSIQAASAPPSFRYFDASPEAVLYNNDTELSWDVRGATKCTASSDASVPFANWNGSVPVVGDRVILGLTSTTNFTLSCEGAGGKTPETIEVLVAPRNFPPPTLVFTADKDNLAYGESTRLRWTATGADYCDSYDGTDDWWSQWWGSDTTYVYPTGPLVKTETFTLKCFDTYGQSVEMSRTIRVGDPGSAVVLKSFVADRYNVSLGDRIDMAWDSDNATYCVYNDYNVATGARVNGPQTVAIDGAMGDLYSYPPFSKTYVLTCYNSFSSASRSFTVTVDVSDPLPGPPPPPAPDIDFWTDNDFVSYNTATTLHWEVKNADTCTASSSPATSNWVGSKNPVSGSASTGNIRQMDSDNDAGFLLECEGPGGWESSWIWIEVGHPSLPGPSLSFWADNYALPLGGQTRLRWDSDADWCWSWGDWANQSRSVRNLNPGFRTSSINTPQNFYLQCGNYSGGSVVARVNISVGSSSSTPSLSFWSDDAVVPIGGSTNLRWNAYNVASCTASATPISADWTGPVFFIGGKTLSSLDASREYTLRCIGVNGNIVESKIKVGVGTTYGSGPSIDSIATDATIVQSGTIPSFYLSTSDVDECCVAKGVFAPLDQWNQCRNVLGGEVIPGNGEINAINSSGILAPITSATTYSVVCHSAAWPGSETSKPIFYGVGQVLLCPASTDRNIIPGNTLQFDAWYTEDSSVVCSNISALGGVNVTTTGASGTTSWSVISGGVSFDSDGLVRGNSSGVAKIRVSHKPAAATATFSVEADVLVGLPIDCYRCDTSSYACSSETQFDFVNNPAVCTSDTYGSLTSCRFACFKDRWQEVAP